MSTGKKMMLSAAVALAIMAALPAGADEASAAGSSSQSSKQGNIGAVTGIAIGALAGGPVGAVVGAGVGVAVGESLHRQQQSKAALQSELKQSEAQRAQLNASIAQLDTSLSQARERNVLLDQTLQHTDELRLDVSFRTNDDSVMAGAMSPLLKLGALVAAMPQARLRVAGYADPRGSDACNDALSLHRAENVAAVLVAAGVPRERIALEGHGKSESTSEDGDLDAYALDRHVTVQVQLQDVTQVARND
jgi:outer membrane protein OmpA-like peptidoglycan-associated protein